MTNTLAWIFDFILIAAMLFVWWSPVIEAYRRHHRNRRAIFALTLLAGWTVLGWIIALVWAHTDNVEGHHKVIDGVIYNLDGREIRPPYIQD